jgi:hypothetical protein
MEAREEAMGTSDKHKQALRWFCATALLAAACEGGGPTSYVLGYGSPETQALASTELSWTAVPGATGYRVVVSLDRAGWSPVAITALAPDTRVKSDKLAWQEGHPMRDRDYFWAMRAYDAQGALLTGSEGRAIRFGSPAGGLDFQLTFPTPSPAPTATASPGGATP